MKKNASNAYQKVQTKTANPAQRVLLVYNGIAKSIRQAIANLKTKDPGLVQNAHNAMRLAEDLIIELKLALDKKRGGEVAENLDALYDFWIDYLSDANIQKDTHKLEELLYMVNELCEGWEKVAETISNNE